MANTNLPPRFQPCILLHENNIPCVVWFEDVLQHYGVPTEIFELYLLVPNIDQAVKVLEQSGWTLLTTAPAKIGNAFVGTQQRRLRLTTTPAASAHALPDTSIPPPPTRDPPKATETVLLSAIDWNFTFSEDKQCTPGELSFIPDLAEFLDALIDTLLDASLDHSMFWGHIASQTAYLYGYNSMVKDRSFAQSLSHEHRQYHLDSLSGMRTGTVSFIKHQRMIRDKLRHGSYTLCECSANDENEDLFPGKREKELLQSMM